MELLPPDVLSPPNGSPAVPMLVALFSTALAWNVFTWWFGIPNSSSLGGVADWHCRGRRAGQCAPHREAVNWERIWDVLRALAISPVLGFVGAGLLHFALRHVVKDKHLYEPPRGGRPPVLWIRSLLILTCTRSTPENTRAWHVDC